MCNLCCNSGCSGCNHKAEIRQRRAQHAIAQALATHTCRQVSQQHLQLSQLGHSQQVEHSAYALQCILMAALLQMYEIELIFLIVLQMHTCASCLSCSVCLNHALKTKD